MRTIHSLAIASLLVAGCGVATYRAGQVQGALEMRLVATGDGERVPRFFSGEPVALEPEAFVDASNVREVRLETRPDDTRHLVLYLDEVGTQRLAAVTRDRQGQRLAIVVDGRVVVAPIIRTEISDGVAHVTVGPEGDLEQVFDALTQPPED